MAEILRGETGMTRRQLLTGILVGTIASQASIALAQEAPTSFGEFVGIINKNIKSPRDSSIVQDGSIEDLDIVRNTIQQYGYSIEDTKLTRDIYATLAFISGDNVKEKAVEIEVLFRSKGYFVNFGWRDSGGDFLISAQQYDVGPLSVEFYDLFGGDQFQREAISRVNSPDFRVIGVTNIFGSMALNNYYLSFWYLEYLGFVSGNIGITPISSETMELAVGANELMHSILIREYGFLIGQNSYNEDILYTIEQSDIQYGDIIPNDTQIHDYLSDIASLTVIGNIKDQIIFLMFTSIVRNRLRSGENYSFSHSIFWYFITQRLQKKEQTDSVTTLIERINNKELTYDLTGEILNYLDEEDFQIISDALTDLAREIIDVIEDV